jgi:hypothetical protein
MNFEKGLLDICKSEKSKRFHAIIDMASAVNNGDSKSGINMMIHHTNFGKSILTDLKNEIVSIYFFLFLF